MFVDIIDMVSLLHLFEEDVNSCVLPSPENTKPYYFLYGGYSHPRQLG